MPSGRGDSATMAAAPRAIACVANDTPSAFRPRRATNTAPLDTRRESYAIDDTGRLAGLSGQRLLAVARADDVEHVAECHCGTPATSAG